MSVLDGFQNNHPDPGLLGTTAEGGVRDEGNGVYFRQNDDGTATLFIRDLVGNTVEDHHISSGDLIDAIRLVDEHYGWQETTEQVSDEIERCGLI